jgi:hypothetical protein
MFERENENDSSDQENEDYFFKWIDDVESQPIKKSVSFSNVNIIHLIKNREEIGWDGLNMYMSKLHFKLIEDEFKKEYNAFLRFNREQKSTSRDEMAIKIYEFIQSQSSLKEITLSKE